MTYSLGHVRNDQRLIALLDTLDRDVSGIRRLLDICDDVMDLPGRRPPVDPDRTGRQATHGPSRPTEVTALDPARALLTAAVEQGVTRVARATALVRGTAEELDQALAIWEGLDAGGVRGTHGCTGGTAGDV